MRRLFLILATFVTTCEVSLPQTRDQLVAKFGPEGAGGYAVSPDARLSVVYGIDQQACSLELRSNKQGLVDHQQPSFEPEIADKVLNDVAPPAVRAGKPRVMLTQTGCVSVASEKYSSVSINRLTDECKGTVLSLVIEWTRPTCRSTR